LALPIFVITIFISSSLLFLVQPMVGKMILPRLGGAPQVWNTCMVFFQAALLAGYGYTHTASSRLPLRRQLLVHCGLLVLPLLFLVVIFGKPFDFDWFNPPPGGNPIPATLWVLTIVVGVPFFVVATSAPLLQKWFASTGHPSAHDPYFLYAASNLGSMLALISYPTLVEPVLGLRDQAWMWTGFYALLAVAIAACAYLVWKSPPSLLPAGASAAPVPPPPPPEPKPAPVSTAVTAAPRPGRGKHRGIKKGGAPHRPTQEVAVAPQPTRYHRTEEVTGWRRLRWVALAAVPSSLMLGVTTYITTDISAITFFWIVPLTLYLLSFILVFMRSPILWTDLPHLMVVLIQPVALLVLVFFLHAHPGFPITAYILVSLLAFFLTALVCHGELAKDRPATKYLTEYYLWMSVGGVVGGIFNAIVSPILFTGIVEYPLALALAGFLRPEVWKNGVTDLLLTAMFPDVVAQLGKRDQPESVATVGPARRRIQVAQLRSNPAFNITLDVILGLSVGVLTILCLLYVGEGRGWSRNSYNLIGFVIPLALCLPMLGRPLRFGLAFGGVILVTAMFTQQRDTGVLAADRSYFGVLRVRKEVVPLDETEALRYKTDRAFYTYLMHGTTYHGQNYQEPKELRRLATTYYHRKGPEGVIMERFNWFPGPQNTYWADNRLPASVVGMGASPWGPLGQLVAAWSEPAYATIGLGTGTMASYGRPFQHVTFYDIDSHIVNFSLPFNRSKPLFNYLQDAQDRGTRIEVIMGDARLAMREELLSRSQYGNGAQSFPKREKYYHMLVVDAFSSDAIPVHLITEEAIKMYFEKLTDHGVLCVHTSNRHVELIKPVSDIAVALGKKFRVGEDVGAKGETGDLRGLFGSEWIMLANHEEDLPKATAEGSRRRLGEATVGPTWYTPEPPGNRLWTDDYSNLLGVFRW